MDVKSYYVPATMPGIHLNQLKHLDEKAFKMWWWKQQGFFQYNKLLISVFYCMYEKAKLGPNRRIRKELGIPDDVKLYGDSGGFQSQTLGKVVPNEDILEWYENNCDYGFIQDFPIEYVKLRQQGVRTEWNDKDILKLSAEFQAKSNQQFLKAKLTKCKLYNVLHGENVQQMEHWFNTVKNDEMYGWASGQKPTEAFRIAFKLAYFYHKGIRKNIHIFAASGSTSIPILVYAAKYMKNITYDSSSWAVGDMYRSFINPLDLSSKITIGEISKGRYTKMPCTCPVCKSIKNVDNMYDGKAISSNMISLHNLWWMLWYVDMWKAQLEVEYDFRNTAKRLVGDSLVHCLDYFDLAIKDFDRANSKYWDQINIKRGLFRDEQTNQSLGETGKFDLFKELDAKVEEGKKKKKREKKPKKEKGKAVEDAVEKKEKKRKVKEKVPLNLEEVENMEEYL